MNGRTKPAGHASGATRRFRLFHFETSLPLAAAHFHGRIVAK